jgi:hypothetical protein
LQGPEIHLAASYEAFDDQASKGEMYVEIDATDAEPRAEI